MDFLGLRAWLGWGRLLLGGLVGGVHAERGILIRISPGIIKALQEVDNLPREGAEADAV
jgi:hypothetical protein